MESYLVVGEILFNSSCVDGTVNSTMFASTFLLWRGLRLIYSLWQLYKLSSSKFLLISYYQHFPPFLVLLHVCFPHLFCLYLSYFSSRHLYFLHLRKFSICFILFSPEKNISEYSYIFRLVIVHSLIVIAYLRQLVTFLI